MQGTKVTVVNHKGKITLIYKNKRLTYKVFDKKNQTTKIVDTKQVNDYLDHHPSKALTPKASHPWKQYYPSRLT
jgi:hypothetical protein